MLAQAMRLRQPQQRDKLVGPLVADSASHASNASTLKQAEKNVLSMRLNHTYTQQFSGRKKNSCSRCARKVMRAGVCWQASARAPHAPRIHTRKAKVIHETIKLH